MTDTEPELWTYDPNGVLITLLITSATHKSRVNEQLKLWFRQRRYLFSSSTSTLTDDVLVTKEDVLQHWSHQVNDSSLSDSYDRVYELISFQVNHPLAICYRLIRVVPQMPSSNQVPHQKDTSAPLSLLYQPEPWIFAADSLESLRLSAMLNTFVECPILRRFVVQVIPTTKYASSFTAIADKDESLWSDMIGKRIRVVTQPRFGKPPPINDYSIETNQNLTSTGTPAQSSTTISTGASKNPASAESQQYNKKAKKKLILEEVMLGAELSKVMFTKMDRLKAAAKAHVGSLQECHDASTIPNVSDGVDSGLCDQLSLSISSSSPSSTSSATPQISLDKYADDPFVLHPITFGHTLSVISKEFINEALYFTSDSRTMPPSLSTSTTCCCSSMSTSTSSNSSSSLLTSSPPLLPSPTGNNNNQSLPSFDISMIKYAYGFMPKEGWTALIPDPKLKMEGGATHDKNVLGEGAEEENEEEDEETQGELLVKSDGSNDTTKAAGGSLGSKNAEEKSTAILLDTTTSRAFWKLEEALQYILMTEGSQEVDLPMGELKSEDNIDLTPGDGTEKEMGMTVEEGMAWKTWQQWIKKISAGAQDGPQVKWKDNTSSHRRGKETSMKSGCAERKGVCELDAVQGQGCVPDCDLQDNHLHELRGTVLPLVSDKPMGQCVKSPANKEQRRLKAIDIGASPGGWSYALAMKGVEVLAVDPGELRVRHSLVKHVKCKLEDDQAKAEMDNIGPFDIVVCDFNQMPYEVSAVHFCNASLVLCLLPTSSEFGDGILCQFYK